MELPPGLRLSVEDNPSWDDREFVDDGLGRYNAPFLRNPPFDYFGVFVRGEDSRDPRRVDRPHLCRLARHRPLMGRG